MFVCLGNICRSPIAEGCAKKVKSLALTLWKCVKLRRCTDPYFFDGFEKVFSMIDECAANLVEEEFKVLSE